MHIIKTVVLVLNALRCKFLLIKNEKQYILYANRRHTAQTNYNASRQARRNC